MGKSNKILSRIWLLLFVFPIVTISVYLFIPEEPLPPHTSIDSIFIYKSQRKMLVYAKGKLVKTYSISLGKNPSGAKNFEGDQKTPEGIYLINDKNSQSQFYKNLGISYPNEKDIEKSKKTGKSPGGNIKIHGIRNGFGFIGKLHRYVDWTSGCIAVTNNEIDELYSSVLIGAKIEIIP